MVWCQHAFGCFRNGCRCELIVTTPDSGGEFRFLNPQERLVGVVDCLNEAVEIAENDDWPFETESDAAGSDMNEHQHCVDPKHSS